jgi:alpha-1,4-digalacturonate transport system permease protein
MNKSVKPGRFIVYIALLFVFLFPVFWILLSSLKTQSELFTYPLTFFPEEPTIGNYVRAFQSGRFLTYLQNSAFVAVVSTVITVLINTMAGYALSKYNFAGRDTIFFVMIATLMIPLQVIMIPIFILEKNIGLLNTLWGIIIPPAATPTGVFLARQYMMTIPNSLIESARIDGAGEWFIFQRIIMPLAKPIIATIAIFSFMWRWNDFLWPFIVISQQKKYTLQLALSNFVGQYNVDWSSLLSMTVIAIIPMVVVFLFFQKYFIKGLSAGGVKY